MREESRRERWATQLLESAVRLEENGRRELAQHARSSAYKILWQLRYESPPPRKANR